MFIFHSDGSHQALTHLTINKPMSENYARHFHENYEMLLHINGDADYVIDGNRFELKKYDLLFIPASTYHFAIPLSDSPYENYVIYVTINGANKNRIDKLFAPPYVINIGDDSRLISMFNMFDFYYDTYSPEDFAEASAKLIDEILIYSCYKPKSNLYGHESNLITQITSFVAQNLQSDINASVVAEHLNFSSSYIQNLFSSEMGIGLMHYINQKKIYAAHADIINGLSPNEAADKYHYNSYSSFFRHYVKIFGVSPKHAKK